MSSLRDVGNCEKCGTPLVDAAPVAIYCPKDDCPNGVANNKPRWEAVEYVSMSRKEFNAALDKAREEEREALKAIVMSAGNGAGPDMSAINNAAAQLATPAAIAVYFMGRTVHKMRTEIMSALRSRK